MSGPGFSNDRCSTRKKIRDLKCNYKLRYPTVCAATKAADTYNGEIALVMWPMTAYYCPGHACFHKGHDRRMSSGNATRFLKESRSRYLNNKRRGENFA